MVILSKGFYITYAFLYNMVKTNIKYFTENQDKLVRSLLNYKVHDLDKSILAGGWHFYNKYPFPFRYNIQDKIFEKIKSNELSKQKLAGENPTDEIWVFFDSITGKRIWTSQSQNLKKAIEPILNKVIEKRKFKFEDEREE